MALGDIDVYGCQQDFVQLVSFTGQESMEHDSIQVRTRWTTRRWWYRGLDVYVIASGILRDTSPFAQARGCLQRDVIATVVVFVYGGKPYFRQSFMV
jgi:hypothetical protein